MLDRRTFLAGTGAVLLAACSPPRGSKRGRFCLGTPLRVK
jgi:hypothetical protein